MMWLRTIFLLALVVFAACSTKDEKAAELKAADLVKFKNTIKVKKRWSADAGKSQGKRFLRFVPAIENDVIYTTDRVGNVKAVSASKGKNLWSVKLKENIGGGVGSFGSQLILGSLDGAVISLSAEDGSEQWRTEVSSEVLAVPASDGNVVIAQTIDGRLYALDASTGEERWRYDHATPVLTLRGLATPVIDRSQVLAAFDNGQIVSLNLDDGALQWSARVSQPSGSTDLERISDVDSKLVIDGGLVYAANYNGALVAFSRAQGQAIWKQEVSTSQNILVGNGKVVVVDDRSHVHAYNASSGAKLWANDQMHRRNLSAAQFIGDDYIAMVDDDDHLHVLAVEDGSFAWRGKAAGEKFISPPVAHNDGILLQSADGKLSFYSL